MKRQAFGSQATAAEIVDHVLCDAGDINVVVGPLLRRPTDGTASHYSYFIIATCNLKQQFRCDQICGDAEDRATVIALLTMRKPRVILDLDSELAMARMCEALWPGERITRLRKGVEAEQENAPA